MIVYSNGTKIKLESATIRKTILKGRLKMIRKISTILFIISILAACSDNRSNDFLRQPMVGIIQNNEVPILIKTISEGKVRIEYKKSDVESTSYTDWSSVTEENGLSTSLFLKNVRLYQGLNV